MTDRIEIVDRAGLAALPEPDDPFARTRARYTRLLVAEGAARLIDNADVETLALVADGEIWPLVLSNPSVVNADMCSPLTWYVRYVPAELTNVRGAAAGTVALARALPMSALLRLGSADRVVYVNNWLAATNPAPGLPSPLVPAITDRLIERWPDRAIVLRSIAPVLDPEAATTLRAVGYTLIRSRRIYVVDGRDDALVRHGNVRRDLAALENTPYEIVGDPVRLAPHANRIAELYRGLYLGKYVRYNPQLNERFFERTIAGGLFRYQGLFRDGRLDGIVHSLVAGSVVGSFLLAHDQTVRRSAGLYRMLIALLIRQAIDRQMRLNLSSGVGAYKELRGARGVDEFDAVYDAHLSGRRRLPWSALRALSNRKAGRS